MSTHDFARDILRRNGISTMGMSGSTLATRAGSLATRDFPIILSGAVGRSLRAACQAAPPGVKMTGAQTAVRDFRAKQRVQPGEAPTMEKVLEGGEFPYGAMAEAAESYRADTYGRIISISRQAIIDDDLGAFSNLAARFGQAAAQVEAKFLADLLVSNPAMSDGTALLHADHANLAGSETALSAASLGAAKQRLRRQTGFSDEPIAVTPAFIIVPPELEEIALRLVATITPNATADVNADTGLAVIVEPRLSDQGAWYLAASRCEIDGLEYACLEGAPGLQIESRNGGDLKVTEDSTVKYRSDTDLSAVIADCERPIDRLSRPRVISQVRVRASKGLRQCRSVNPSPRLARSDDPMQRFMLAFHRPISTTW